MKRYVSAAQMKDAVLQELVNHGVPDGPLVQAIEALVTEETLLVEARTIASNDPFATDRWRKYCLAGAYDKDRDVQIALAGLKRGLELAQC